MRLTSRTTSWLLAGIVALAAIAAWPILPLADQAALAQQPCGLAGQGDDAGEDGFEIDGQFLSGDYGDPGNDWAQGSSFAGVILDDGTPNPVYEPALRERDPHWAKGASDPTTFSGRSNKNNDDISFGADPWSWARGNGPQKNDLTDVYAHATVYDVGGTPQVWLYLGATTRAVNGDSHVDFEWNIAGLEQRDDPKPLGRRIYGLGPDAGRTVDIDFIVSVDFVQGGEVPLVSYRAWKETSPGEYEYEEFIPGDGEVYVCTNVVDLPAPPWGAIAPNGDPATEVVALQFVEMAVNLTAIGVDSGDLCSASSTMLYKTRSSQSFVAELKDYALYPFPFVAQPVCAIDGPGPICEGSFPVELCGVEPVNGHVYRYTWTGPVWADPYTTYDRCVEVNASGTYQLVVADETNGCSSDACEYDLLEIPLPPCDVGDETACVGGDVTFCGPEGDYLWTWTYPDGSTETTRCITIDPVAPEDEGTYALRVQDATHPECETLCSAYLGIESGPDCFLEVPCSLPDCCSYGNELCGPDLGPGYTYSWELVSSPTDWYLVPPFNEPCITYTAGDPGEATFRLTITDESGCSGSCEVTFPCTSCKAVGETADPNAVADGAKPQVPLAFALGVNSPNPVRGRTMIGYAVPVESRVSLTVHNLRGQVVAVLEDGVVQAGYHTNQWPTAGASPIASGVYFYKMEAVGLSTGEVFRQTAKMVVIQ